MKPNEETTLKVEGMSCPSCVSHIEGTLRELKGVREVNVQFEQGQVLVRHDSAAANVTALVGALKTAGYEAAPAA
jgi:copper ion binding protein